MHIVRLGVYNEVPESNRIAQSVLDVGRDRRMRRQSLCVRLEVLRLVYIYTMRVRELFDQCEYSVVYISQRLGYVVVETLFVSASGKGQARVFKLTKRLVTTALAIGTAKETSHI